MINNGAAQTIQIYFEYNGYEPYSTSSDISDSVIGDHTFTSGATDFNWLVGHALVIGTVNPIVAGEILIFMTYPNEPNDDLALLGWWLILI